MKWHSTHDVALLALLAGVSFGGSCTSDNSGGYDRTTRQQPVYDDGPDRPAYTDDRNDRRDGDHVDADRPHRIPRFADLVRHGPGKLKWTADLDGTFYVYDRDRDEIRYAGPARHGDEIIIQPDEDRIYVLGRVVSNENLRRDGSHELYFAAARADDRNWPRGSPNPNAGPPDRDGPYSSAHDTIPDHAQRLTRGPDVLTVTATPRAGTIFIYDETFKTILYQTPLKKGASFQVIPRDGLININSQTARRMQFAKGHNLSLYFVSKKD